MYNIVVANLSEVTRGGSIAKQCSNTQHCQLRQAAICYTFVCNTVYYTGNEANTILGMRLGNVNMWLESAYLHRIQVIS